jgi:putative transcriptional regulator
MSGQWLAGGLLVASPVLVDPNFHRTVVLILQHDGDGAVGVVLNRPSGEPVRRHLPAWEPLLLDPPVVFVGGPVEPSMAIGVLRTDDPADPTPLSGVGLIDLADEPGDLLVGEVRIYSGYAGWAAGQLEAEIEEGAWVVVPALPDDVFSVSPADLWARVLRRQGGRMAMLATFPPDPSWN